MNSPSPSLDHGHIFFTSHYDETGQGFVQWQQGQYDGCWSAEQAIALGAALLLVAGVSLAEGAVAIALLQAQNIDPDSEEYLLKQSEIFQIIRATRMEISQSLQPIFGFHLQVPLVEIGWYKTARTVSIEGAMEEACLILEAANAAIVDGRLHQAMTAAGIKSRLQEKVFKSLREGRR